MTSAKRLTNRIAALATAPLPPELLVPELVIALHKAIGTDSFLPSVLVSDPTHAAPQDFVVWRGSENNTDELRALLQMGFWPAPSTIPSLQRLMTERLARSVYASPLWGDGCPEEGPWESLWRDRGIRHGYYAVAFSPSGRVTVMLMSRGPDSPAFSQAQVALGEAAVPFIARAAERQPASVPEYDTLVAEIAIAFGEGDRIATLGIGGPELLRDLGGGGPGAGLQARALLETAARRYRETMTGAEGAQDGRGNANSTAMASHAQHHAPFVAGPPEEAAFRRSNFKLMSQWRSRGPSTLAIASTAFGAFDLRLAPSNDLASGDVRLLGALRHRVPRVLAVVRGLIETEAPGREIELALQLSADATIADAAHAIGLAPASAKTLLARLAERFAAHGKERLLDAIVDLGTRVER